MNDDVIANVDGDNNEATYKGILPFNFFTDTPGELRLVDGSQTVGGNNYTYDADAAGTTLTAKIGGTTYFTVTLNPTTGEYTVTLNKAIPHPAGNLENNLDFNLTYEVEDSSGDVATGSLVVNVDDDTPAGENSVGVFHDFSGSVTSDILDDESQFPTHPGRFASALRAGLATTVWAPWRLAPSISTTVPMALPRSIRLSCRQVLPSPTRLM